MEAVNHDRIQSTGERLKTALVSTLVFYILENGYRLSGRSFSGDGLLMLYKDDAAWEVALGRFVHPLLTIARGGIAAPFLTGALTCLWIGLSVFLMTYFLRMNRRLQVILTAAICVCNVTVVTTAAAYLFVADYYAFALFMAVAGVWLAGRADPGEVLRPAAGAVLIMLSMGIYQAYVCVAIGLAFIDFIFGPGRYRTRHRFVRAAGRYAVVFAAAGALYYMLWKLAQMVFHVWTSDSYNGMSGLFDFGEKGFIGSVIFAYWKVFEYLIDPEVFITFSFRGQSLGIVWKILLIISAVLSVVFFLWGAVKALKKAEAQLWQRILNAVLIILFPLAVNAVCVLSKGMEHSLMTYAFVLIYVGAVKGVFIGEQGISQEVLKATRRIIMPAAVIIISWTHIVYANQLYLKLELMDKAAQAALSRIVYDIEHTGGYEPGVTPVVIAGSMESSQYLEMGSFWDEVMPMGAGETVMPYPGTEQAYLRYCLGTNMNLITDAEEISGISGMPVYPEEGSVRMTDGTVVVKISE